MIPLEQLLFLEDTRLRRSNMTMFGDCEFTEVEQSSQCDSEGAVDYVFGPIDLFAALPSAYAAVVFLPSMMT
jgi:hypothetical protein